MPVSKPIRFCEVFGCQNKAISKGLCQRHYNRKLRTGSELFHNDPGFDDGSSQLPPDPVRGGAKKIPSLRAALKAGLSDEEVARLLEDALRQAVDAEKGAKILCPSCHKIHWHQVPDWNARVNAWKFLMEQTDGRTPAAPPEKPKVAAGKFEEMTDEQLAALLQDDNEESDDSADQR